MKKLINIKKQINFENILIIYIILHPIIDIITSLCVRYISDRLSLGIIIRTIFMAFIVIYSLIKADKKSRWKLLIYYLFIGLYILGYVVNSYTKYGLTMIFTQIKGLIKTFYFPIILSSFLVIFKDKNYASKKKYLNIALAIYVLTIAVCKLTSIGFPTYPFYDNEGTIGLFYAGNEISAIISILCSICFSIFIAQKFNFLSAILCIITSFVMLEIGTKVAFISFVGILLLSLIISFIKTLTKENKDSYKQFITIILITIFATSFIQYSSVGKNLNIKIFSFNSSSSLNNTTEETPSTPDTPTIEHPIELLSGRNIFLNNTISEYKENTVLDKILGNGYISISNNEIVESKLIEIDYLDIFFCHGILGFILYMAPLLIIAFILIKKFFTNFIINIQNYSLIFIIYSILIGFGIALVAGHVLTAPSVSMFLILMIFELSVELNYERTV